MKRFLAALAITGMLLGVSSTGPALAQEYDPCGVDYEHCEDWARVSLNICLAGGLSWDFCMGHYLDEIMECTILFCEV